MDVLRGLSTLRTVGEVAGSPAGRAPGARPSQRAMTSSARLAAMGTSPRAIMHHYDLSDDFFRLWLGPEMVYSCAWWDAADGPDVARPRPAPQARLLRRPPRGRAAAACSTSAAAGARCSTGSPGCTAPPRESGLTLSPAQADYAARRHVPGVSYSAAELGRPRARRAVRRDHLHRGDRALRLRRAEPGREGRGLPRVLRACRVVAAARRADRPAADLPRQRGPRREPGGTRAVLRPDPATTSSPSPCPRRCPSWCWAGRRISSWPSSSTTRRTTSGRSAPGRSPTGEQEALAQSLVGPGTCRTFARYFAAGEAAFRLREHALLPRDPHQTARAQELGRRRAPERPPGGAGCGRRRPAAGASAAAVRSHYDVSNSFYRSGWARR